MFPGCKWFNLVLTLVGTVSLPGEGSCPTACSCSNVSAICRPGLTRFPSGLPPGLTAIWVSGTYSSRNIIPIITTPYLHSRLERLYMTFSNIIEVVCGALPTTLITLDLSYNNIQEISDCSLKGLTRRKQLHLTENNETTISYSAFRD